MQHKLSVFLPPKIETPCNKTWNISPIMACFAVTFGIGTMSCTFVQTVYAWEDVYNARAICFIRCKHEPKIHLTNTIVVVGSETSFGLHQNA